MLLLCYIGTRPNHPPWKSHFRSLIASHLFSHFCFAVSCFRVTVPHLSVTKSRNSLIPNSGQKLVREHRSPKSKPPAIMQQPVAWNASVSPPCQTALCLFWLSKFLFHSLWDRWCSSVPLLSGIARCAKQRRKRVCSAELLLLPVRHCYYI